MKSVDMEVCRLSRITATLILEREIVVEFLKMSFFNAVSRSEYQTSICFGAD